MHNVTVVHGTGGWLVGVGEEQDGVTEREREMGLRADWRDRKSL